MCMFWIVLTACNDDGWNFWAFKIGWLSFRKNCHFAALLQVIQLNTDPLL